jgi:hypothetical protein
MAMQRESAPYATHHDEQHKQHHGLRSRRQRRPASDRRVFGKDWRVIRGIVIIRRLDVHLQPFQTL